MNAPVRIPAVKPVDPWFARCRAAQAKARAHYDALAANPRPESPAEAAFTAALNDHADRMVEARRETLRQFGDHAEPCRDVRLDLAGDHRIVAHTAAGLP